MNRRYLELYSANRNRKQFPNMAQFDVLFGAPRNVDNPLQSQDPVLNGPIYFTWQGGQGTGGTTGVSVGRLKTTSDTAIELIQSNGNPIQGLTLGPTGPTILSQVNNYYLGYGFTNQNISQSRLILNYNPSTAGLTLNTALVGSSTGDLYIIFDPSSSSLVHIPAIDGLGNTILGWAQAYNGYWLVDETLSYGTNIVARQIINYDHTTQLATLSSAFPSSWQATDFFTLRKTLPNESMVLVGLTGGNQLVLPSNVANPTRNYYQGKYLYNTTLSAFTGGISGITGTSINSYVPNTNNEAFYIAAYGGASGISGTTPIYPYSVQLISTDGNQYPGTYPGITGQNIVNIVEFSNDNAVPLIYNGSMVSVNESVCYEIALINLTLPNVILTTGSRIAFYPFVYVQLSNIASPTAFSGNSFYSNNPESYNALFQCAITDVTQPLNSSFVKVDSGVMTQTVKFKPNDSLRFSVFLPDGQLFMPLQPDNLSPYPTNPILQIDAIFSIKRL